MITENIWCKDMALIFEQLNKLGLTSLETRSVYSTRTRDVEDLVVWKDNLSGVIYIDDYYVGDHTYTTGAYRAEKVVSLGNHLERQADVDRRYKTNKQFIVGKNIFDFGCGAGDFLRMSGEHAAMLQGVELQESYIKNLQKSGIRCTSELDDLPEASFDTCFSFHVIEHLPDPIGTLCQLRSKLKAGGTIVIEVPHANDFLLSIAGLNSFKDFTLWSQHLVLHNRESLRKILDFCGFKEIVIDSAQRFSLANHMNWMIRGQPGGHKSILSVIETDKLKVEYAAALSAIDSSDTLVAYATV